ncbi:uncharacterized protein LOC129749808 [Uranotaenia lowii]|uniref:uncharacterized protein LOC129749808 n=1 Tax=Uranotaenia lowii TaxID=190385 RepID=UPI00247AB5B0|nr:uncharacterized protein LOC129749808 [Uranotaenia lowii]XP_055600877.1 uncharacterized protein LOC129749808 [Uranotaenia lowii]XP_055600878.1 uncharacterized protein LOC129749808 [Uranotaenia lowii]
MAVKTTAKPTVLNSRRSFTRTYYLPGRDGRIRVCKEMFMATLDITDKKTRTIATKLITGLGLAVDDLRSEFTSRLIISEDHLNYIKAHINSFPAYSSHYCREKSQKKYLSSDLNIAKMFRLYKSKCVTDGLRPTHYNTYRKIFRTMRLSFRKTKLDTCNECDKYAMRLKLSETEEEKEKVIEARDRHHTRAAAAYSAKKIDMQKSKIDPETRTACFDLQKCLPTPHLTCGMAYYARQLYTLNFTIFATTSKGNTVDCYLWDETKARRGCQEIGSCLWKDLLGLDVNIKYAVYYSDRCFGQNLNFIICCMFTNFIFKCCSEKRNLEVSHKFLTSGHSHMEVDSAHAAIERAKKNHKGSIETPRDWAVFIASIHKNVPFHVYEMSQEEFLNFKKLLNIFTRPKTDHNGNLVRLRDICHFRYTTSAPGIVFYKYNLEDEFQSFSVVDFSFKFLKLDPITTEPLSLAPEKLEDLKKLLPYVSNKAYYQTMLRQMVPKKRGRKPKGCTADDFEADLDRDIDLE